MPINIPHPAFPPRFTDGLLDVVEQDSSSHKADRIHLAALTTIGQRLEDPTFGVPDDLLRAPDIDIDAFRQGLAASEPAAATIVDRITNPTDVRTDRLRVLIDED